MEPRVHTHLTVIACLAALATTAVANGRGRGPADRRDADPAGCDGTQPRPGPLSVTLFVVNQAGADDDSLAAAEAEARDIWVDAGLRLVWLQPGAVASPADGRLVTIIVRDDLVRHVTPAAAPRSHVGEPLGWTLFADGAPTNTIEVSMSAVTALVRQVSYGGKPVIDLPTGLRRLLIGRALGRVIAHEIGHWIGGRAHAPDGLMRLGLSGEALISQFSPAPPRGWIRAATSRRLTGPQSCG
jgi:hypothetical protein